MSGVFGFDPSSKAEEAGKFPNGGEIRPAAGITELAGGMLCWVPTVWAISGRFDGIVDIMTGCPAGIIGAMIGWPMFGSATEGCISTEFTRLVCGMVFGLMERGMAAGNVSGT